MLALITPIHASHTCLKVDHLTDRAFKWTSSTCLRSRMRHLPPSKPKRMYTSVQLSHAPARCSRLSSSSPLNVSQRACMSACLTIPSAPALVHGAQ